MKQERERLPAAVKNPCEALLERPCEPCGDLPAGSPAGELRDV